MKYKYVKNTTDTDYRKVLFTDVAETEIIKYQLRDHPILEAKHSNTVTNARNKTSIQEVKNHGEKLPGSQAEIHGTQETEP